MRCDDETRERRSVRLAGFDYTSPGGYFVTICTHNRQCLLGNAAWQKIVEEEWGKTADVRPGVNPEELVVMPNHVHGIVMIGDAEDVGAYSNTPLRGFQSPSRALGAVVRGFKASTARRINRERRTPGGPVWQRNYYERVIRSEDELNRIREYIRDNPVRWAFDQENPEGVVDEGYEREWGWLHGK